MEHTIREAFDSLTMPRKCAAEIEKSLQKPVPFFHRPLVRAVCLVLALLVLAKPVVVRGAEHVVTRLQLLFAARTDMVSVRSWLIIRDGRLYFVGDGEETDITQKISPETPFTAQYDDEAGIRHYIAVGGTFNPDDPEYKGLGWCHWKQKPPYDYSSWIGGSGRGHWDNENERKHIWLEKAEDILGIPFP